ncbi:sulfate/molybdate ABC transporter ATP-binding protein [uncultured Oscillibacter sp.]|uniref:sulfate/molybdate ABC transporter ATP-binding protein n=1 Tax=uncultured Oscillibacter sp. TaxID=876091 RepID=UPI0025E3846C|nr:ATP-binding cassette domain-containing protein [uncultured Oscillibacter sp.]
MSLSVSIRKRLGSFFLDVQFEADRTPLALFGASGCGKSVTLKCIAGILRPDEGRITLDGRVLFDSAAGVNLPPQQRQVGYLFQQYALFPNMTVRQNIAVAVRQKARREAVADELLHRMELEDVASLRPRQLSGGQQQRTALARILASEPNAILLDEPFSALDSYLRSQLEVELSALLSDFRGPLLWVSHDRGEVFRNCPAICVMERGHTQPVTSPERLVHHPATEAAARLAGCENFADAQTDGTHVFLPQWGITLPCSTHPGSTRAAIRAAAVHPAAADAPGAFSCSVERILPDVGAATILLRPDDAPPGTPPLRMALPSGNCPAPGSRIHVQVNPDDILLFPCEKGEIHHV